MTDDAFRVVTETEALLAIELGAHGLDGEADELLAFVRSRLAGPHHDAIELDGKDAAIVTSRGSASWCGSPERPSRLVPSSGSFRRTRPSIGSSDRPALSDR